MNDNYSKDDVYINRKFKNDLFVFLFGRNKEFALSLYNAMNNSSYDDPDGITFNTIDNFIYLGRQNDVSFLIENTVNVYEHQSTINANIAFRMFLYVSRLYEKYATANDRYLYSDIPIDLPSPNFIVFYYGKEDMEDDSFVYLSDAMAIKNSNLELRVRVINANYGHNNHLLNKCPALYEYSWFLKEIRISYNNYVRSGTDHMDAMIKAFDKATDEMPDVFIIKEIILSHKAEVIDMLYTIEDEPRMMKIREKQLREEGRIEGHKEGKTEGLEEGTKKGYEKGRKETRTEDAKMMIDILLERGFSETEARQIVESKFNEISN
ncbi:MAG: hypothetical protein J6S38_07115 [Erysipelotrichaceae bacterium]|nr:hypothetical protein [Erysipelotrichaceae bacterium]